MDGGHYTDQPKGRADLGTRKGSVHAQQTTSGSSQQIQASWPTLGLLCKRGKSAASVHQADRWGWPAYIIMVGGSFNPSNITPDGGRAASVQDLHRSRANRGRRCRVAPSWRRGGSRWRRISMGVRPWETRAREGVGRRLLSGGWGKGAAQFSLWFAF